MSPEQAKGRQADKRSDVWAFGCVLYEMLAGKRVFEGEDLSDTLAFVLTKEPDWTALPPNVPSSIRILLKGCLERDRRQRIADISTALFVLKDPASLTPVGAAASLTTVPQPPGWQRAVPWAATAIATSAAVGMLVVWAPWSKTPPPLSQRLSVELGAEVSLITTTGASAILSPDGQTLAFVAQKSASSTPQLYVRRLDQLQATPLSGTDNAGSPFFSPDWQWVAFFAGGKLKKISVTGGASVTLCEASNGRGGWWAEDGTIVFAPNSITGTSVWRVSSAGGKAELLTTVANGDFNHRWPQLLPEGPAAGRLLLRSILIERPSRVPPRGYALRGAIRSRSP